MRVLHVDNITNSSYILESWITTVLINDNDVVPN